MFTKLFTYRRKRKTDNQDSGNRFGSDLESIRSNGPLAFDGTGKEIKMTSFWLKFAIQEAVTVATLVVQSTNLTAPQKAALENFIAAAQALIAQF